ncbi:MAG: thioredoxin family protein [Actinomycetota bacterium]
MVARLLILAGFGVVVALAARLLRSYFAGARIPTSFERRDVDAQDSRALLVEFTSPFCYDCQLALPVLEGLAETHSASLAVIDAKERPDLAAKYGIRLTPTILVVDGKGAFRGGWLGNPPQHEVESALVEALATA